MLHVHVDPDEQLLAQLHDVADVFNVANGDRPNFLLQGGPEAFFEGVHLFFHQQVEDHFLEVRFQAALGRVQEGHNRGKTSGGWTCKAHPSRLWLRCCGCFGQFGNTLAGSSTAG